MPTPPAPHNLLTPFQQAVLGALAATRASADFALAGGTAIAEFHLGHRRSDDLDFLSLTGEGIPDLGAWLVSALPDVVPDAQVDALRTFAAHHRYLVRNSASDRILVDLGVADPGLTDAPLTVIANLKATNPHTMPWPVMVRPLTRDALQRFITDAITVLLGDIALAQHEERRPHAVEADGGLAPRVVYDTM